MMHDDGQHVEGLEEADVVLVGVSRTSKTPTSIYLANRGVKTGNVPLVPGVPLAPQVEKLTRPLVVGLYASPERIVQIRENRLLGLKAHRDDDQYIDKAAVAEEVAFSRRLCAKHSWPIDRRDAPLDRGNRRGGDAAFDRAPPRAGDVEHARSGSPINRWCSPRSSDVRGKILAAAGLRFEIRPAQIDERADRRRKPARPMPPRPRGILARAKARRGGGHAAGPAGARRRPDAGARQHALFQAGRPRRPRSSSCAPCAGAPMSCIRRWRWCATAKCCLPMSAPRG